MPRAGGGAGDAGLGGVTIGAGFGEDQSDEDDGVGGRPVVLTGKAATAKRIRVPTERGAEASRRLLQGRPFR